MGKSLKLYWGLILVLGRNSLAAQLEFRANFLSGVFVEIGYFFAKLSYVFLIYRTGTTINGMTPDYILLFIGTYAIMTGIYMSFYPNFCKISDYIKDGTMDFYITKPVSPLFLVSFRYIDFAMPVPNILGGVIMTVIAWKRCGFKLSFLHVGGFLLFIILGTILAYFIFLLPRLLSFWFISTGGISDISDSVWDFNNMPMGIYNRAVQGVGCFLFPIFLITNVPGLIVGDQITTGFFLWALMAPLIFGSITMVVWRWSVKHYSSASS